MCSSGSVARTIGGWPGLVRYVVGLAAVFCLFGCTDTDDSDVTPAATAANLTLLAGAPPVGGGDGGGGVGGGSGSGCTSTLDCPGTALPWCFNGSCVQCVEDIDCLFIGGTCVNHSCQ